MLLRTHTTVSPWWCVRADHKKPARLNVMRHLLHETAPKKVLKAVDAPGPNRDVLFGFDPAALTDGRLAR